MSPEQAEEWGSRYEEDARHRGLARHAEGFWRPASDWIAEQGGRYDDRDITRPRHRRLDLAVFHLSALIRALAIVVLGGSLLGCASTPTAPTPEPTPQPTPR